LTGQKSNLSEKSFSGLVLKLKLTRHPKLFVRLLLFLQQMM